MSGKHIITPDTVLLIGDQYYPTRILSTVDFTLDKLITDVEKSASKEKPKRHFKFNEGTVLEHNIAYLKDEYYYLYRGNVSAYNALTPLLPGIYYDDENCEYVFVEPETEDEIVEYSYNDKITTWDAEEIRNAVLNKKVIIFNTPDSSHSPIPPESVSDDILKRIIKRAIQLKGIDLDQYKTRFASKNMLFNTKQVLRGPNKLSILLFDRCIEALNLKYTIIIEEAGGEEVGVPMEGPIILSSHTEYEDMQLTTF